MWPAFIEMVFTSRLSAGLGIFRGKLVKSQVVPPQQLPNITFQPPEFLNFEQRNAQFLNSGIMKKMLHSLFGLFFFSSLVFAQCDELFISTYHEGTYTNKALEIYNPTPNAIDLSGYSVGRYSNGETSPELIQLPDDMLQPYDVYVVVLDKRNPEGTGNESPVWNGYLLVAPLIDEVTMEEVLDSEGNPILVVQYDLSGASPEPMYGDVYNENFDLQGKADKFLCPDYDVNNAMYFNGNDAVALFKGSDNIVLDVVGVVGDNPDDPSTDGVQGWTNVEGFDITVDETLVRKPDATIGKIYSSAQGDEFKGEEWFAYPQNSFYLLGDHDCECDPSFVGIDTSIDFSLNVYPNPSADGYVLIDSEKHVREILVFDMTGRKVRAIQISESVNRLKLNLGSLPNGVYAMHLKFENGANGVRKISLR